MRYVASLKLLGAASLTFGLVQATPLVGGAPPEDNAARYDPATGILSIPRVAVFDAGGEARQYRATLQPVPGAPGLQFHVTDAVPLPMQRVSSRPGARQASRHTDLA